MTVNKYELKMIKNGLFQPELLENMDLNLKDANKKLLFIKISLLVCLYASTTSGDSGGLLFWGLRGWFENLRKP